MAKYLLISYVKKTALIMSAISLPITLGACSSAGDPMTEARAEMEQGNFVNARLHLLNALKENRADPETNFLFARTLLELGDGRGAQTALDRLAGGKHYQDEVPFMLAEAMFLQGKPDQALEQIDKAGKAKDGQDYAVRAAALFDLGKTKQAVAATEEGLEAHPENVKLLVTKGNYELDRGNLEAGKALAERALKADHNNLFATLLAGRAALIEGDKEQAEAQFERAVKNRPDHIAAFLTLGAIYADNGDIEHARGVLEHAIKLAPDHPVTQFLLARLAYEEGDTDKAFALVQKLGSKAKDMPQAMLLGAQIDIARGNNQVAISKLTRALTAMPESAAARMALARAYVAVDAPKDALTALKPLVSEADAPPEALALAGKLAKQVGDPLATSLALKTNAADNAGEKHHERMVSAEQAIANNRWKQADDIYNTMLANDRSTDSMVLNNAASVKLRLGHRQDALRLARKAHKLEPSDPFAQDTLAWVLFITGGSAEEALDLAWQAYSVKPDNVEIVAHYAQIAAANGQVERGRNALEKAKPLVDANGRKQLDRLAASL